MRISTNQLYDQTIRAIMDNQKGLADTQEQLSTGKKIIRPSDDPVGAATVVRLTEEVDKLAQYQRNNDLVTGRLEQQESILSGVQDAAQRARVLIVQSGNGIFSDEDRRAIAAEIEQIRDQVFDAMNAQDAAGNFIFAGFQSTQEAFEYNPAAINKKFSFVGDAGENEIQLSDNVKLRSSVSGQKVFEDVDTRRDFSVTGTSSAGVQVNKAQVTQQGTFDAFYEKNYATANLDYQIDIVNGEAQLSRSGTGDIISTTAFQSGQPFTLQGMEFNLEASDGDSVQFSLDPKDKKNLAETLNDIFLVLSDPAVSGGDISNFISDALVGIDNASAKIAREISSIGGRLNVAESIYANNLDLELLTKEARSDIEDVDYAEASAEFAKQEAALSAALSTFPKITGMSLFDYIG